MNLYLLKEKGQKYGNIDSCALPIPYTHFQYERKYNGADLYEKLDIPLVECLTNKLT